MFYYLNGLSTENVKTDSKLFFLEVNGQISFGGDQIFLDIDRECNILQNLIEDKILGDDKNDKFKELPLWVRQGGLDSDCQIDDKKFTQLIQKYSSTEINRTLYIYDCISLISFLQNRIASSKSQFFLFYKELSLTKPLKDEQDGIYWTAGFLVERVFSMLNNFVITTYSILDQISKVAYLAENLASDFTKWPKLSSSNILYSQGKKLKKIQKKNTVFETAESISFFEVLRK